MKPSETWVDFTYEVLEVTPTFIKVKYPDDSWAEVPVFDGDTKQDIMERMKEFYHPVEEGMGSAEVVPFLVGETGDIRMNIKTNQEEEKNWDEGEKVFSYMDFRLSNYPSRDQQLRALYEARQGDDTLQQECDARIKEVDELYPEDMPDMTAVEHIKYMENLIDL